MACALHHYIGMIKGLLIVFLMFGIIAVVLGAAFALSPILGGIAIAWALGMLKV